MKQREELVAAAKRCLDCRHKPCQIACPAHNRIPEFLAALKKDDFSTARSLWTETSNLPELCGALCQQEMMCEGACTLNKIKQPIRIGFIEAGVARLYAGDVRLPAAKNNHRHLVIGMGPAGLANAIAMAEAGCRVDAVDANARIGGAIWNLVPSFRFDADDLTSIEAKLTKLGVSVRLGFVVGRDASLAELVAMYDSVFIAHGLDSPQTVPGFTGDNVFYAIDLLDRVRHTAADLQRLVGRQVVVVGLGSVAVDMARTLVKLGKSVTIAYRRTLAEAPASPKEIAEAIADGVKIEELANPTSFHDGILKCEKTILVH
ncbi:MAG: FAD-dependent oxidoreductase, partial [bacterium]